MSKKKVNVSQESFLSSTEEVKETLTADVASEAATGKTITAAACENVDCHGYNGPDNDTNCSILPTAGEVAGCPDFAGVSVDEEDDTPTICINTGCTSYDAEKANACAHPEHVYECSSCGIIEEMDGASGFATKNEAAEQEVAPQVDETAETGKGIVQSYVTRDPDFIGPAFTRSLPVPVPDEELAELAKEMSHAHRIWIKAQLDKQASAKGFKTIIDQQEVEMVRLAGIIEVGTEERPTNCRWEFDYAAGTKKLRRLDNHKIIDEETLKGEELHMSFNFNGSSEAAVEQLAAKQTAGANPPPAGEAPPAAIITACDGCQQVDPNCAECPDYDKPVESICIKCVGDCDMDGTHRDPHPKMTACTGFSVELSEEQINHRDTICTDEWRECEHATKCFGAANEQGDDTDCLKNMEEFKTKPVEPVVETAPVNETPEFTLPTGHPCKLCGFDGGSHIYLVRHLRDVHAMKLSEYKKQFPA